MMGYRGDPPEAFHISIYIYILAKLNRANRISSFSVESQNLNAEEYLFVKYPLTKINNGMWKEYITLYNHQGIENPTLIRWQKITSTINEYFKLSKNNERI